MSEEKNTFSKIMCKRFSSPKFFWTFRAFVLTRKFLVVQMFFGYVFVHIFPLDLPRTVGAFDTFVVFAVFVVTIVFVGVLVVDEALRLASAKKLARSVPLSKG